MDVPLLINHIAMVLENVNQAGGNCEAAQSTKLQETVVLYYFSSLMQHAEQLNNAEVLANLKELNIIPLLMRHAITYSETYSIDILKVVSEGLSALTNNEDFDTDWQGFFPHDGDMQQFQQLEIKVAGTLLAAQPERKKDIRSLLD